MPVRKIAKCADHNNPHNKLSNSHLRMAVFYIFAPQISLYMEKTFEITDDLIASKGQRLANFFIDYIIRMVIALAIGALLGLFCVLIDDYELLNSIQTMSKLMEFVLGLIILILYYTLTGIFFKRSIAKFITKTLVVFEDGTTPDNATFFRRALCRIIPFEVFSFLGTPSRGWHDSITDTYVVRKEEFEQAMESFYSLDQIGSDPESND